MKKALSLFVRVKTAFLIGLLFSIIAFSGCLEPSSNNYASPTDENIAWTSTPIPVSTYRSIADDSGNTQSVQNINGVNKVIDVSGKIIRINGQNNEIKILNKDVSEIWVNGQGNVVYYPKEARPMIKDNGVGDEIKTY